MKQMLLLAASFTAAMASYGQTDSTQTQGNDTINIGSMVIIKKKDANGTTYQSKSGNTKWYSGKHKPKRLETSWFTFDFGFNNLVDETDYTSAAAMDYARAIRPGEAPFTSSDFNLRNGKSINTNIWIFRQKWGMTQDRVLKLTYGLMLELNNYRFDTELKTTYKKGSDPYVFRDKFPFRQNKMALDYVTIPLMIGFDTKPGRGGFTMSAGVSIGYLYSSRNKQISNEKGKQKIKGNFDIEPWKFQYIGEIGVGPMMLYASYAPQTFYKTGLEHMPYNFGIRLGDWDNW